MYRSPHPTVNESHSCEAKIPHRRPVMLHYAVVFFVIALIAALFGFTGIAAGAAGIAKVLFVVFLVVAAITLIMSLARRA
jgi:uncharacterized membrane protein YtjA (UPF0391 family)